MTERDDGKRPWYQQALGTFQQRTKQLAREREIAENFQEDGHTRVVREQREQYADELHRRATAGWWANRDERQYIKEAKQFSPEVRDRMIADLIRKRMVILEERDRQAYLKRIMAGPERTLRERLGQMARGERER